MMVLQATYGSLSWSVAQRPLGNRAGGDHPMVAATIPPYGREPRSPEVAR
jgi:hypothetical protein